MSNQAGIGWPMFAVTGIIPLCIRHSRISSARSTVPGPHVRAQQLPLHLVQSRPDLVYKLEAQLGRPTEAM